MNPNPMLSELGVIRVLSCAECPFRAEEIPGQTFRCKKLPDNFSFPEDYASRLWMYHCPIKIEYQILKNQIVMMSYDAISGRIRKGVKGAIAEYRNENIELEKAMKPENFTKEEDQ